METRLGAFPENTPERVTFQNSRGTEVIGDLHKSSSKSIIVMSHGLHNDRHEGGRFDSIAGSLSAQGVNVIKYDFNGNGESLEDVIVPEHQRDDLRSLLKGVQSMGFENIGLLGYSFGGYISAGAYSEDTIKSMVLWAPVSNKMDHPEGYYGEEGERELKERNYITRKVENSRPEIHIGKDVFQEWESINQQELLAKIKCPVLIVHGKIDPRVPFKDSEAAIELLPAGSELKSIEGGDHIFSDHLDEVFDSTTSWFGNHLPR